MEEKCVGAARGTALAETAGQKLSAPKAYSHTGGAQVADYPQNPFVYCLAFLLEVHCHVSAKRGLCLIKAEMCFFLLSYFDVFHFHIISRGII